VWNCIVLNKEKKEVTKPVLKEIIEDITGKNSTNYRNENGKLKIYGKCPSCKNPVQIIGFYKKSDSLTMRESRPYAKHCGYSVKDIANHDEYEYRNCPYHAKQEYNCNDRRAYNTGPGMEIRNVLAENIDIAIYIVKRDTGVRYSSSVVEKMLETYVAHEAWQYVGATLENIPWILAYMSNSQNINHQYIEAESPLHKELRKKKYGANFSELQESGLIQLAGFKNRQLYLAHYFTTHKSSPDPARGKLNESVEVVFTLHNKSDGTWDEVLRRKIKFDHDYFFSLLNFEGWKRGDKEKELINMARRLLL